MFKEAEGITVIIEKNWQMNGNLPILILPPGLHSPFFLHWKRWDITAAFSAALAKAGISCNVVAAVFHDHIFVAKKEADKAMHVLSQLSETGFTG